MSEASDLIHPRDEIMRTMERIYRYRMTTTSGGNLSIRDEEGAVWITPARLDKGRLRREDIVCVWPDGTVEGPHRPSSEYPFHRAIYEARTDLRAIVHAHPVALVAFSICRRVPDTRVLYQSHRICGTVGFAPYALPGSDALGRNIADAFAKGFTSVVLENHGVVTGGSSLPEAFGRFETLEFTAKTLIKANLLGEVRSLDEAAASRTRLGLDPGPRDSREPASNTEKELRRQLCEFVSRSYQQRLVISTQGAFSARLGSEAFLITPHRLDRIGLDPGHIVLVQDEEAEPGRTPSTSARNHRAIYREHPEIQAIVNAYPVNATAFGITGAAFDSRTIPESYVFLREVHRLPFGTQFEDGRAIARAVSPRRPIALLEHDGVLVCGTSILDAFDRLEVLESTAEAMINSRPIGSMVPMPDSAIAELTRVFLGEDLGG